MVKEKGILDNFITQTGEKITAEYKICSNLVQSQGLQLRSGAPLMNSTLNSTLNLQNYMFELKGWTNFIDPSFFWKLNIY